MSGNRLNKPLSSNGAVSHRDGILSGDGVRPIRRPRTAASSDSTADDARPEESPSTPNTPLEPRATPLEQRPQEQTPLDQRTREGSNGFAFDTLLSGVSASGETPEPNPTPATPPSSAPEATPAPRPRREPRPHREPPGDRSPAAPNPVPITPVIASPPPDPPRRGISPVLIGVLALLAAGGLFAAFYRFGGSSVSGHTPAVSAGSPASSAGAPGAAPSTSGITSPKLDALKGLPDPSLTPGQREHGTPRAYATDTETPAEDIRQQVLRAYGADPASRRYVLVRLIPASLNGTNRAENLFPVTPWFSSLKARLDKYLTDQVLAGKISVEQAEKELTGNWIDAAHKHYIRNYGETDQNSAREIEDQKRW